MIRSAADDLAKDREPMRYGVCLTAGYPKGSGVAEGARRHLDKDRIDQMGVKWAVTRARARLHTRISYINEPWNEFQECRIT